MSRQKQLSSLFIVLFCLFSLLILTSKVSAQAAICKKQFTLEGSDIAVPVSGGFSATDVTNNINAGIKFSK